MLWHMRLGENGRTTRVYACRQPVNRHVFHVLGNAIRRFVMGGEGVPIGNKEKARVLVLHFNPVFQDTVIMPQV